jgi:hypothetical protein
MKLILLLEKRSKETYNKALIGKRFPDAFPV